MEDVSKAEVAVNLRMDQLHWVLDQDRRVAAAEGATQRPAGMGGRAGYAIPPTPAVIEYEVSGLGGKTYRWNGTLVRYDGIGMDNRSRTVPVTIEVDAPHRFVHEPGAGAAPASPSALVRGMFVKVRLQIKPRTPLVAIPSLAIRPGNRVWHFQDDPSVLTAPLPEQLVRVSSEGNGETGGVAAVVTSKAATAETSVPPGFDPSDWMAGRVRAVGNLTAVDSLWVGEPSESVGQWESSGRREQRRYWVCNVRGGELAAGDWVVVSPLGELGENLSDASLPVRVRVSEAQP